MMRALALALLAIGLPAHALAAQAPRPGYVDPHIQTIDYDPQQVVLLKGRLGYQMMVEFGAGERLESVSIGDALGWQVTPNRNANLLFLKPLEANAATNMSVVTDRRRYTFELMVLPKGVQTQTAPYSVRFIYPQVAVAVAAEPEPERPPEERNRAYAVTGSAENAPARVFDDGQMTYFTWAPQASAPAIFAIGPDGKEALVNYGVRGEFTIVQQLAPRFILRNGKAVTTVTNRAYGLAPAAQGASQ
jgi:type IV secretion system protein VirB9